MPQVPLTRTSRSGTSAKSRMTILRECSRIPANQKLIWNPTPTETAYLALPVPPLAPESTYLAETIAHQSSFLLITSDGRSP